MNSTQKIIVLLLVLAILFSAVSIFISYSALNIDLPDRGVSGRAIGSSGPGGVSLTVETPPASDGGGGQ